MNLYELFEQVIAHDIPRSKYDYEDVDSFTDIADGSLKPRTAMINPRKLMATQDWIDTTHGGGKPRFEQYTKYPVVFKDADGYHILDGHHRTYRALNRGDAKIKVYLFDREADSVNEAAFADLKKRIPSFLVDEWHEGTGIPKKVLYLYGELGQDQRARPEQVMVQLQPYVSGVLDFCIEHVGDLSNRATPNHGLNWSWGSVKEKAEKTYRTLTHAYGFEREFEENLAANAQYRGLDLAEYKKKVDAGLTQYAAAHAELLKNAHCPLHKNCVRAAVSLGKKDFAGAATFLQNILRLVKTKESYINALRDYEPKLNQTLAGEEVLDEAGTKNSDKDRANAWIEKVYARFPYTFNGSSVMVWGDGDNQQFAIFDLVPSPIKVGAVDIKWLQAMPQRQGVGSRALKVLQDMAREDGITLTLRPWSKGKISQSQLTKFYKKQGFKNVSKGDEDMVWSP